MLNVPGSDLAWALIDAAKPHLNTLERNYVFVTVGAGDTFAGVHQLLKLIAAKRIPLPPHLVMLCSTWLGPYAGHEEYEYLRRLIEGFLMPDAIKASTPTNRVSLTQKPRPLHTVARAERPTRFPAEHPQRSYVEATAQRRLQLETAPAATGGDCPTDSPRHRIRHTHHWVSTTARR
jgi:hypothetical protein